MKSLKPAEGWTIAKIKESKSKILLDGQQHKKLIVVASDKYPKGSRIWTNNSQNILEIEKNIIINDKDIIAYK